MASEGENEQEMQKIIVMCTLHSVYFFLKTSLYFFIPDHFIRTEN